jgi:hypothetical protein
MQEMQEMRYCSSKEIRMDKNIGYIPFKREMNDLRHLRRNLDAADEAAAATTYNSAAMALTTHAIPRATVPP